MNRYLKIAQITAAAVLFLAACAPAASVATASPDATTESAVVSSTEAAPAVQVETAQSSPSAAEPQGNQPPGPPPDGQPGAMPPGGAPPDGAPPGGAPPGGGNPPPGTGGGATSSADGLATATGAYELDGGSDALTTKTLTASNQDQSGVYVKNGGSLSLKDVTVNTSGDSSSDENSSFYGLNAGVLAASGSAIAMEGGSITTTGRGANGAFATGSGSVVKLSGVAITDTGDGGHGVMATQGGEMELTNVDISTSGPHSAPVATDRGGGTITAAGGTIKTTGQDSPCYYSTGTFKVSDAVCTADGSEVVVIEGANSVDLTGSSLTSSVAKKWGVMIYQSFSGDALGSDGVFTMNGGSLAYTDADSPLFYVTNTHGHITLKGVDITAASGTILRAEGNDRWGKSGANGGTVEFTADAQTLKGDFSADAISSLDITLKNGSALQGAVNSDDSAKTINLSLDTSSSWSVTADSHLTCLDDSSGISGTAVTNISGNGHTVTYDSAACPALGGKTYSLANGGSLMPAE